MLTHLVLSKRKRAPYLRAGITLSTRSWPGTPMGAMLFCWHDQPCKTSTSDTLILCSRQSEANQNHFTVLSKYRQKQGHLQTRKYHALAPADSSVPHAYPTPPQITQPKSTPYDPFSHSLTEVPFGVIFSHCDEQYTQLVQHRSVFLVILAGGHWQCVTTHPFSKLVEKEP